MNKQKTRKQNKQKKRRRDFITASHVKNNNLSKDHPAKRQTLGPSVVKRVLKIIRG